MPEMGNRNGFFPAYDCAGIDMKHLGKDFLRDAQFLSEVSDVVCEGADERLRGGIYAGISQLSLNHHADTPLPRIMFPAAV